MTAAATKRSWYGLVLGDILDLAASQPYQVLLSTGQMSIVAAEAAQIMQPVAGIAVALGAEWAFLRGVASGKGANEFWVKTLTASSLILTLAYGALWGGRGFGAIPVKPDAWLAWLMTAIHILPLALIAFSAAMVHRSSVVAAEAERTGREQAAEQRRLELEQRRQDMELEHEAEKRKLELWSTAQKVKAELKQLSQNSVTNNAVTSVTPHSDAADREVLRQRVVQIVTEARQSGAVLNVSQAWQQAGLSSRAMWYKLIKEAEQRGEL